MRKVNSIFLLLFLSVNLFSQDWNLKLGDLNAEWVYDYNSLNKGVTKVKYEKDTMLDDRIIRIFSKTAFRKSSEGVLVFERDPIYIFEEGGVVEYSVDLISFDTLYNFQAQIGESWIIPKRDNLTGELTGDFLERKVLDTFVHQINGGERYCLGLSAFDEATIDTTCQGIGSRVIYILPFDNQAVSVDGGEGGPLRCFKDNEIGVFDFEASYNLLGGSFSSFDYDCDQLSSVNVQALQYSSFEVLPNPASSIVNIRSNNEQIENYSLYNLHGQLFEKSKSKTYDMDINVSKLPSGMYFLIINDQYFEKLVVADKR